VAQSDCHPEPAFAQRGIWASRAVRRVLCDARIARLARFLIELSHWRFNKLEPSRSRSGELAAIRSSAKHDRCLQMIRSADKAANAIRLEYAINCS
jgi:hypothetical protein